MGRRGRKRQLEIEDAYWTLILGGVGTVDACKRVGIGRKTGYRWRAERGGAAPARVIDATRGRRYLSRGPGARCPRDRAAAAAISVDHQPRAS